MRVSGVVLHTQIYFSVPTESSPQDYVNYLSSLSLPEMLEKAVDINYAESKWEGVEWEKDEDNSLAQLDMFDQTEEEKRADIVGQNGNEGLHYEAKEE